MRDSSRRWALVFRWAGPALGMWLACSARAASRPTAELEQLPPDMGFTYRELQLERTKEGRELYRKRVIIPDGAESNVRWAEFARAGRRSGQKSAVAQAADEGPLNGLQDWLLAAMLIFVCYEAWRKLGPRISESITSSFNAKGRFARTVPDLSAKVRAEEAAFSEFVKAFRVGAPACSAASATGALDLPIQDEPRPHDIFAGCDPVREFFAGAPAKLAKLRKLLQELGRNQTETIRQQVVEALGCHFRALKGEAGLPELLPVWQMASALEGLLKQLMAQISNVTPSTLRTVASAVDLLEDLCQPGAMAGLGAPTAGRLLVVDDDLISRRAVAYALKRAFDHLELAEHGEEALHWAAQQTYDAVFLDVMMPGMDGFEVCAKIHETEANRETPVVFVTCQSDFDGRAQSILAGGNDLIAKPFLSFEITVKALTFVLRNRLRNRGRAGGSPSVPPAAEPAARLAAVVEPPSSGTGTREEEREVRPEVCASKQTAEKNVVRRKAFLEAVIETGAGEAAEEARGSWGFRRHRRFAVQW